MLVFSDEYNLILHKDVPLDATLSSKPTRNMSRFKANLYSSGAAILPQGQSHILSKSVRRGRLLPDGSLAGGEAGDSDPEGYDEDQTQRTLDMLLRGEMPPENDTSTPLADGSEDSPVTPPPVAPSESQPRPKSKFALARESVNTRRTSNNANAPTTSSKINGDFVEKPNGFNKPPTVISKPSFKSAIVSSLSLV